MVPPRIMQPQLDAFTQKLMEAASLSFSVSAFCKYWASACWLAPRTEGILLGWRMYPIVSLLFIYVSLTQSLTRVTENWRNTASDNRKTPASGSQRQFLFADAEQLVWRSSPACDTLLRLPVYPPALARNNPPAGMIHAHSARELLMRNLKIPLLKSYSSPGSQSQISKK